MNVIGEGEVKTELINENIEVPETEAAIRGS